MNHLRTQLIDAVNGIHDELIACRRDFHKHPETAWTETRTASLIAAQLKELGMDELYVGKDALVAGLRLQVPEQAKLDAAYVRALSQGADPVYAPLVKDGFTAVVGILDCGEGPVVAIRADIDALPVLENDSPDHFPAANGFRSVNKGLMHACGHDANAACVLTVAKVLSGLREQLHGKVIFLFQPAEEGARGAHALADAGWLDEADVLLAMHLSDNRQDDARIVIESNKTLATTKLDVTFHGKDAHAAAAPQTGHNAVLAACTAVTNLYAISRSSEADTRINVGTIRGGESRNLIPANANIEMETRGTTTEGNEYMLERSREVLNAAAAMHGCTVDVTVVGAAGSSPNDPELARKVESVCRDLYGIPCVYAPEMTWSASEDFSILADRVKAHGGASCYMKLISNCPATLHDACFDLDEEDLSSAVLAMAGVTAEIMK